MEAIVLAGGKGERLGEAAQGLPKPLVPVGGRPLMSYELERLGRAGVTRVAIACTAGQEEVFERELAGYGPEIVVVGEPQPLGRGGGIRHAAQALGPERPVFAMNGDEIADVDFGALVDYHRERGPAATIVVAPLPSAFGVVELAGDDTVEKFREAPRLPHWVNAGIYVLEQEALDAFPERGDHETTAFPVLAEKGRLLAYRHEGMWLTVNTPKELRAAEEALAR